MLYLTLYMFYIWRSSGPFCCRNSLPRRSRDPDYITLSALCTSLASTLCMKIFIHQRKTG